MIIYKRNKKEKEIIRVTCKNCTSILGIEEKDIINLPRYDQREGRYTVKGFKCIICESEQELKN